MTVKPGSELRLSMVRLDGTFDIHRLDPSAELPGWVFDQEFVAILKTTDELSVVCQSNDRAVSSSVQKDWVCLRVDGPLDFEITGVIARISALLAKTGVPVFVVSSYETDYVFVPSNRVAPAVKALESDGISVRRETHLLRRHDHTQGFLRGRRVDRGSG